ncbi:DUF3179 domain-containing protein [Candidatus Kaiserbacteria bacterium]|nr:DUF3179 domain-containing protein [Candidatus Kaiserbacteria bacterium]
MKKALCAQVLCLAVLFGCLVGSAFAQRGEFVPPAKSGARKPIVDAPFVKASEVTDQVTDNELVLGVVIEGQARAYPINMLTGPSREIINDQMGRTNFAATW